MNVPPRQSKFQAYRARKKAAGLREVRMWVPNTRAPGFAEEAKRQSALLDHSEDEQEASRTMRQFAQEAWDAAD